MNSNPDITAFKIWLSQLPAVKANGGPARGTVAGALVVLSRLKTEFNLKLSAHLAPKGAQVKGTSGAKVSAILSEFGETRVYLSEGGRTNRGLRDEIKKLLECLSKLKLEKTPPAKRVALLIEMQALLVDQVRIYHNRQRLSPVYDSNLTSCALVGQILQETKIAGKEGPVAQYLVGAKLQLRYPLLTIENHNATTADAPSGRKGDFLIGDTAFHVTVAPMPAVFEKCRSNLADGLRAYLLVPRRTLEAAQQMAGESLQSRVSIISIETFVAQNIDEIGAFAQDGHAREIARLLNLYNERVNKVETDKSLLVEIPRNLLGWLKK